jgi:hypothetical protein
MADTYNNIIVGESQILGSSSIEIGCEFELQLAMESGIDCECYITQVNSNRASGEIEIIPVKFPQIAVLPDDDTYVKSSNPFFSYYEMASLPNGNINGVNYISLAKFSGLSRLDQSIAKNILSAKLVLYPTLDYSKGDVNISLYDLNKTFDEENVSYISHPTINNKVADSSFNTQTGTYEFDITQYATDIATFKKIHTGFGFNSDKPFIVNSSNSSLSPRIVIEYKANLYVGSLGIPVESNIRYASMIPVECTFDDEFPKIDCECILSRESIEVAANLLYVSSIDVETKFAFPPEYSIMECECLFSKESIAMEASLASLLPIDVECILAKPDNSSIDVEMKLTTVSHILCQTDLLFKSEIGVECYHYPILYNSIDCECLFSKDNIEVVAKVTPLYTDEIVNETNLLVPNNTESIDVECILSIESIRNETIIKFAQSIDVETMIVYISTMDVECILATTEYEGIDVEAHLLYVDGVDCETAIVIPNAEDSIDMETNIIMNDNNSINVEMVLEFKNLIEIMDVEANLALPSQKYIDCEANLLVNSDKSIDVDAHLLIPNNQLEIPAEFHMVMINNIETIELETNLLLYGEKGIDVEFVLVVPMEDSINVDTYLVIPNNKLEIPAEFHLCIINNIETIEAETNLLVHGEKGIDVEFVLVIPMEASINVESAVVVHGTSDIPIELTFKKNDATSIVVETIFKSKKKCFIALITEK